MSSQRRLSIYSCGDGGGCNNYRPSPDSLSRFQISLLRRAVGSHICCDTRAQPLVADRQLDKDILTNFNDKY